jgi:hypothetical protein
MLVFFPSQILCVFHVLATILRSSEAWHLGVVSDRVIFTLCFMQTDHVIQNLKWEKNTDSMVMSQAYFLLFLNRKTGLKILVY